MKQYEIEVEQFQDWYARREEELRNLYIECSADDMEEYLERFKEHLALGPWVKSRSQEILFWGRFWEETRKIKSYQ